MRDPFLAYKVQGGCYFIDGEKGEMTANWLRLTVLTWTWLGWINISKIASWIMCGRKHVFWLESQILPAVSATQSFHWPYGSCHSIYGTVLRRRMRHSQSAAIDTSCKTFGQFWQNIQDAIYNISIDSVWPPQTRWTFKAHSPIVVEHI